MHNLTEERKQAMMAKVKQRLLTEAALEDATSHPGFLKKQKLDRWYMGCHHHHYGRRYHLVVVEK